ncbi:biotin synthase auxiliary protein BsaP [Pseudarthrobacter sp. J64]|uniref:biotin synthase auxiliary protein BsaP n=1 Tax=Pseudarthrobacter sp. J64 TaxID=3116485 RepID=UPI003FA777B1
MNEASTGVSTGSTTGSSGDRACRDPDGVSTVSTGSTTGTTKFCGHCGGEGPTSDSHLACAGHLALEPPRYCPQCRRRMKVQVTPQGWAAECSRHGRLSFSTERRRMEA